MSSFQKESSMQWQTAARRFSTMCFVFHSQDMGFLSFSFWAIWGQRGGRGKGCCCGLPNQYLVWAAFMSLYTHICGGTQGPSHTTKRQIKAADPREDSAQPAHTYYVPTAPDFSQELFAAAAEEEEGIEVLWPWGRPHSGPIFRHQSIWLVSG